MKKMILTAVLLSALLVMAGCSDSATGNVPRAPPAPSGGGCGIAAPAETAPEAGSIAAAAENNAAF